MAPALVDITGSSDGVAFRGAEHSCEYHYLSRMFFIDAMARLEAVLSFSINLVGLG